MLGFEEELLKAAPRRRNGKVLQGMAIGMLQWFRRHHNRCTEGPHVSISSYFKSRFVWQTLLCQISDAESIFSAFSFLSRWAEESTT